MSVRIRDVLRKARERMEKRPRGRVTSIVWDMIRKTFRDVPPHNGTNQKDPPAD